MKNYSAHADGMSSKNQEQIENTTGVTYRASGNLFIAKQTCRTIPQHYSGTRGAITGFSAGSGLRMRRYLRECRSDYKYMVTLTYPYEFPTNGADSKEHLRRFLQEVQREYRRDTKYSGVRQLHSAFWFLEFQARGAPHYHIFFNWVPSKEWVSTRWYEIVNSEDIRHFHAGTRTEKLLAGRAGTISYASKYANKLEQKICPEGFEDVGRFWGVYGDRITVSAAIFVSRSDITKSHVAESLNTLKSAVDLMIIKGNAEVVRREEGIYMVQILNPVSQQRMRRLVASLAWMIVGDNGLFEDGETDYGEIYNEQSVLYPTKTFETQNLHRKRCGEDRSLCEK